MSLPKSKSLDTDRVPWKLPFTQKEEENMFLNIENSTTKECFRFCLSRILESIQKNMGSNISTAANEGAYKFEKSDPTLMNHV